MHACYFNYIFFGVAGYPCNFTVDNECAQRDFQINGVGSNLGERERRKSVFRYPPVTCRCPSITVQCAHSIPCIPQQITYLFSSLTLNLRLSCRTASNSRGAQQPMLGDTEFETVDNQFIPIFSYHRQSWTFMNWVGFFNMTCEGDNKWTCQF